MDIDDLLARVPTDQLAGRLGVDAPQAHDVARQAITALVGGMGANATDPGGAASLAGAFERHAGSDFPGGTDLAKVDAGDGAAIVANIFGDRQGDVVSPLGGLAGDDSIVAKALPLLAPLVLRWVGGAVLGTDRGVTGNASRIPGVIPGNQGDSGSGLEDLLGGLLGGGGGGGGGDAPGGLGDLLGGSGAGALSGLLGGQGGGADLGGLLDGLLGGGRKA